MKSRTLIGILLIGLGVLFFIGSLLPFLWRLLISLWPLFIVLPGALMLRPVFGRRPGSDGLAVPGFMIAGTGLILLYQSITGDWRSWAYIWTLYPVFFGLGLWFTGRNRGDRSGQRMGMLFILGGLAAFIFFGLIVGGLVWALLLLGAGLWLLFRSSQRRLPGSFHNFLTPPNVIETETTQTPEEVETQDP